MLMAVDKIEKKPFFSILETNMASMLEVKIARCYTHTQHLQIENKIQNPKNKNKKK